MRRQPPFALAIAMHLAISSFATEINNNLPDTFRNTAKAWVERLCDTVGWQKANNHKEINDDFIRSIPLETRLRIKKEVRVLSKSNQIYDVVENYSMKDTAYTSFDTLTGMVIITLDPNIPLGLFAHELLHAYQFDKGLNSLGKGGKGGRFLLDKTDERAAEERQKQLGDMPDMSLKYEWLSDTPWTIHNFKRKDTAIEVDLPALIARGDFMQLHLTARRMNQAFRVRIKKKWHTITFKEKVAH